MKRLFSRLLGLYLFGLYLLILAVPMQASLVDITDQDQLRIKSWLEPVENLVKGQQIYLQIEIATSLKWQGGTTIDHVEIKDAIVLQRENFSVNSVRNEDGKSWLVQLWTLVIYPQTVGDFYLPEIAVNVAITDDTGNKSAGQIKTPQLGFSVLANADIGEAITDNDSTGDGKKAEWIATPSFSIEESFDHSLEDIKPGDAIARTLVFNATDLPAMMLPSMVLEELSGIATYSQPPKLVDKVNRGDYLAQRTEVHTYVVETSGDYLLPEQVYYWWNTRTKSLEKIVLPEYKLHIASTGIVSSVIWLTLLILTLVAILLFLLIRFNVFKKLILSARWQDIKATISARLSNPQKELEQRFRDACDNGNEELALAILYKGLDNSSGKDENGFHSVIRLYLVKLNNPELIQQFEVLMQAIYKKQYNKQDSGKNDFQKANIRIFAVNLLAVIKKSKAKNTGWFAKVDLTLN